MPKNKKRSVQDALAVQTVGLNFVLAVQVI